MLSNSAQYVLNDIVTTDKKVLFREIPVLDGVMSSSALHDVSATEIPSYISNDMLVCDELLSDIVRCVTISNDASSHSNPHLVYFHGGGFVIDMSDAHWKFLVRLAEEASCTIHVVLYPLAPTYGSTDAYSAGLFTYQYILDTFNPDRIVVMGESAGGHLAVALVQQLQEIACKQPDLLIVSSAWLNTGDISNRKELDLHDPMLARTGLIHVGEIWMKEAKEKGDWVQILEGKFSDFPETHIYCGSREVLLPDSLDLTLKLSEAGVPVKLSVEPGLWHTFPLFLELDETQKVISEMAEAINNLK